MSSLFGIGIYLIGLLIGCYMGYSFNESKWHNIYDSMNNRLIRMSKGYYTICNKHGLDTDGDMFVAGSYFHPYGIKFLINAAKGEIEEVEDQNEVTDDTEE